MSWQIGSLAILAVGLLAGFVWYERSKPDAKIVALVGTLAALGVIGRIAFAAIPNVKPTTDIVLIAGYALGGAPGYVVGALSALVSNFFFGQGPWTPWQMAGWGAVGLIGAVLARATRGRIGRWPLAVVCFPVGFAFTALQDVGDWVTYSDHSVDQLGIYVGKGAGFDLIHAVGCVAFALVLGPALIRSLKRFKVRLDVTWVAPAATVLVALLVGLPALVHPAAASAGQTPVQYLETQEPNNALYDGWAALGLEAAGVRPPPAMIRFIETHEATDPGSVERTILALRGAGVSVAGELARLRRDIASNGSINDQTNWTAFGVLALRAGGLAPSLRMLAWLAAQEDSDGGFNFATRGGQSDVDDTGAVVEALAGTRYTLQVGRAVRFIERQQNGDGGMPSQAEGPSNTQSTAFAIQGLVAAGQKATAAVTRAQAYIRARIRPDGATNYAKDNSQSPVWVTGEALMGLAERPLPFT